MPQGTSSLSKWRKFANFTDALFVRLSPHTGYRFDHIKCNRIKTFQKEQVLIRTSQFPFLQG